MPAQTLYFLRLRINGQWHEQSIYGDMQAYTSFNAAKKMDDVEEAQLYQAKLHNHHMRAFQKQRTGAV